VKFRHNPTIWAFLFRIPIRDNIVFFMNSFFRAFKRSTRVHGIILGLSVPLGVLAAWLTHYAILLPTLYQGFINRHSPAWRSAFLLENIPTLVNMLAVLAAVGAAVLLAGMVIGFIRKSWALKVLRACYSTCYLLGVFYFYVVMRVTDVIFSRDLKVSRMSPTVADVFQWRWDYLFPAAAILAFIAFLHLCSWRRAAIDRYTGFHKDAPGPGDLILENLRTHGSEPQFRKSIIQSVMAIFLVIIVFPYLLTLRGCIKPYGVPEGSGTAAIGESMVVNITKIVKPKRRAGRLFLLNPNSSITFHIPSLDDSNLSREIEEASRETYVADPSAVHSESGRRGGRLGAGGGKGGGWPGGMKDSEIRFIRLEYNGDDWDDGMDAVDRADLNFLEEFSRITGFKTSKHNESYPIHRLDDFPKGYAPPFVFMTGSGKINIPPRDIKILRQYLTEGGMLFADCGSPQFDRNFRSFMQALFPGELLLVVSDDEPIYQYPFTFANGAPPLWHHGGTKALGIKKGNRWLVYYHPGDLNDAWKTGYSGLKPELAKRAMQVGINVIYHAFTHYLDLTRKYRK
jgi:hypothetical protein